MIVTKHHDLHLTLSHPLFYAHTTDYDRTGGPPNSDDLVLVCVCVVMKRAWRHGSSFTKGPDGFAKAAGSETSLSWVEHTAPKTTMSAHKAYHKLADSVVWSPLLKFSKFEVFLATVGRRIQH